jgi:hypothetical protein
MMTRAEAVKTAVMTEEQLQQQARQIREQLDALESLRWRKEHVTFVGKHFKYKNSYSADSTWWLYGKVLSIEQHSLQMFTFQITSMHIIEIKPTEERYEISRNWQPIPAREFRAAWATLLRRIKRMPP